MFQTSQPSPEHSNDVRAQFSDKPNTRRSKFKKLEEFAQWLDHQLIKLEANHEQFVTSESVRNFFNAR